jgi:type IV secretion system protein VirB6
MAACPAFDPLGPYVSSVVSYIECQGLTIGEAGYRALGPGSAFGMALTGLLTIYVGLIGYRLLLGSTVTVRDSVLTAVKLGLVLALATQWSAYRVLVFDVVTQVPEAAATGLSGTAGIASSGNSGIATRVDMANAAVADALSTKTKAMATSATAPAPGSPNAPTANNPPAVTGMDSLQWSSGVLSVTALAGLLSVRIIAALLLALGPAFIAAALFDATRGLFVGWLRVLAGTFLGAVAVPVVLNLELAVFEPQVLALRDLAGGTQGFGVLPVQLLGTAAFFALVLVAVLAAMVRAGLAFRLPEKPLQDLLRLPSQPGVPLLPAPSLAFAGAPADGIPSRAQQVASAAQAQDWREARMAQQVQAAQRTASPRDDANVIDTWRGQPAIPLGQEGRRSTPRHSNAATRRDDLT